MFQIIIIVVILFILYNIFYSKEYFSGDITDNQYPDRAIIQDNNILNNLYKQNYLTREIAIDNDNSNDYYSNEIDYQKRGQYSLLNSDNMDYDKYYDIYKHQLKCPCDNKKELGFNNCENDMDVFKISNMVINKNKKKSCVSCNFDKDIGAVLTTEQKNTDLQMLKKNTLVNNNVEKFSEYKEFVNQNTNQFETQVDKLGECRTSEVCQLDKFGETIWDAYDNLLSTDFTKYQTRTNPDILTGSNGFIFSSNYEKIPSIDYNVDKQL
jgi:hypothetical protein